MTTEAPPFKEAMQREDVGMEVLQIEGGGGNNESPNGNAVDEE
jgi:hypothetical protein